MRRVLALSIASYAASGCGTDAEVLLCTAASTSAVVEIEIEGQPVCLGTVIDPQWALTAKHCVQPPGADAPFASSAIRLWAEDARAHDVVGVEVLGGRYESLGAISGRDIALLKLTVSSTTLVDIAETMPTDSSHACVVLTDDIKQPEAVTIHATQPRSIYVDGVTCPGDSGGPLLTTDGELLGVASWRTLGTCGTGLSVFTRLDAHRAWMDAVVDNDASETSSRFAIVE